MKRPDYHKCKKGREAEVLHVVGNRQVSDAPVKCAIVCGRIGPIGSPRLCSFAVVVVEIQGGEVDRRVKDSESSNQSVQKRPLPSGSDFVNKESAPVVPLEFQVDFAKDVWTGGSVNAEQLRDHLVALGLAWENVRFDSSSRMADLSVGRLCWIVGKICTQVGLKSCSILVELDVRVTQGASKITEAHAAAFDWLKPEDGGITRKLDIFFVVVVETDFDLQIELKFVKRMLRND